MRRRNPVPPPRSTGRSLGTGAMGAAATPGEGSAGRLGDESRGRWPGGRLRARARAERPSATAPPPRPHVAPVASGRVVRHCGVRRASPVCSQTLRLDVHEAKGVAGPRAVPQRVVFGQCHCHVRLGLGRPNPRCARSDPVPVPWAASGHPGGPGQGHAVHGARCSGHAGGLGWVFPRSDETEDQEKSPECFSWVPAPGLTLLLLLGKTTTAPTPRPSCPCPLALC